MSSSSGTNPFCYSRHRNKEKPKGAFGAFVRQKKFTSPPHRKTCHHTKLSHTCTDAGLCRDLLHDMKAHTSQRYVSIKSHMEDTFLSMYPVRIMLVKTVLSLHSATLWFPTRLAHDGAPELSELLQVFLLLLNQDLLAAYGALI